MPDKALERFHLDRLLAGLALHPDGIEGGETPDFLVRLAGLSVGVELTTFHLPTAPGTQAAQAKGALQDRTVDIARQAFRAAGGGAYYVTVVFSDEPLPKAAVRHLAQDLARALLGAELPTHPAASVDIPAECLPPRVVACRVSGSVDGIDELWHADGFGWVQEATNAHLTAVIAAKDRIFPAVRSKCDTGWLVVVHDPFREGAPSALSPAASMATYQSRFERVLWLEIGGPSVVDLKVARAAA
jgi:hypothetical protein